jgi:hypothetical protein
MTDFRIDYMGDNGPNDVVIVWQTDRKAAMLAACQLSRKIGTVYAVRSDSDGDTGQRVYENGRFCYADGDF